MVQKSKWPHRSIHIAVPDFLYLYQSPCYRNLTTLNYIKFAFCIIATICYWVRAQAPCCFPRTKWNIEQNSRTILYGCFHYGILSFSLHRTEFLLCCLAAADMPFGFVFIHYRFCTQVQRPIHVLQFFWHVFMYRWLANSKMCSCSPNGT